ncbi:MAG: 3-hydroxyanthranilate 3,4-dioxygenase [Zetaproteobacteria bacterium]|nr:3-hydroxyanthranilate 3,4-dioxygenase [Pseudobdellovibrionaceae bacterium]
MIPPINLKKWIDDNRELLKPPVCNKVIYEDTDTIVMIVGSPNIRLDYHVNHTEELFYQIEGDITLTIRENNRAKDIDIKEGEIFLLPPSIPHSPQRPKGTVGLVVERTRPDKMLDEFEWYCLNCNEKLYQETLELKNIVKDLPPIFERFYNNDEHCTCKSCGTKQEKIINN